MENPVYCDKCKKCMTDESGFTVVGCHIGYQNGTEHIKTQFGKYDYKDTWRFCYECWLDSLMCGTVR